MDNIPVCLGMDSMDLYQHVGEVLRAELLPGFKLENMWKAVLCSQSTAYPPPFSSPFYGIVLEV